MSASQLLLEIEGRGATITVAPEPGGANLHIAPKGLVTDLANDIQKFKPQILELLSATDAQPPAQRDINSARRRLMPGLSRLMCDKDAIELAHKLDLLDQGFDIR